MFLLQQSDGCKQIKYLNGVNWLVKVPEHVGGVFGHHILRVHGVLRYMEFLVVTWCSSNILRTTSFLVVIRLKIEVSFISCSLGRSVTSHGLQVEVYQMSWGTAFFGDMLVASTFLAKFSFIKLILCYALPLVWILWLVLLVVVALTLKVLVLAFERTIELGVFLKICMYFRQRSRPNWALITIL